MNKKSKKSPLKSLAPYLWPKNRLDLKTRVIIALSCLVAGKLVNVTVPFLLKRSIDALSPPQFITVPVAIIVAYAIARVASQGFGELRDYIFSKVSQNAQRVVARHIFEHLHALSLRFHLDRQTGGLSRVIERGTRGIGFVLSFMLFNIIPTSIEILLVTGILFYQFNIQFAAVTFFTILIYIVFTILISTWRAQFRRDMNKLDSEASTKAVDSLLNFETVKYFGNEAHESKRFDASLAGYERAALLSQSSLSMLNIIQGTIIGCGLLGVMLLAAKGVAAGKMTTGDFVMVNTFLIQLYMPLNFLGFAYRETKQSLIDMENMFELFEIHGEVKDPVDAKPISISGAQIEFRNVSFHYNPERSILKNISFVVPEGKKTAIVGPSGSGKSTLSRLLFRFYDTLDGNILIDGQNINQVTQKSLRAAIGIVPQDTVLFNDTIAYNIRYGRPDATFEEIQQAAKLARIHDFVELLPKKYDTVVGERGLKLSGGEKQRVAIARTILKNPKILLFDEATSALDSHTEKAIQSSLDQVSKNRTTLVIAHRLSTVVDANEILVLKNGEIIERGTHEGLLTSGGEYAQMWKRQQEATIYQERLEVALAE